MIRVGQVTGAYGLGGAVKVMPLTDFADRFDTGATLLMDGTEHQVEWSRAGHPGVVVKFRGIDNRTVAELLKGRYLEVGEGRRRALDADRFYHHQVVGLRAFTDSGEGIGVIAEVLERPANDVWVSRDGMIEHLIPATKDAVVEVDLEHGRVVVAAWVVRYETA
ncbi:MAG: ribosome maturation factor RimM [Candidatus Dormibacterales bacterium]